MIRPTVFNSEKRVMDNGFSHDETRTIKRRLALLDYFDDTFVGNSGDLTTTNVSLPGGLAPEPTIDTSLDNALIPYGTTATPNPSLGATPSTLSTTGGAALNTTSANPTVYSTGSQSSTNSLLGLSNSIAQWGFSLADALSPSPSSTQSTTRVVTVGSSTSNSNKNLMLFGLLVLAVVAVIVVVEE